MEPIRLDGRAAVVTGAGSGLGRAHARELARRGATVVVNDLNGEAAEAVAADIVAAGGVAVADTHSVSTDGAAIAQAALDAFGRLDILVNNAGFVRDKAFHNLTIELFDEVLAVHLRGAVVLTREAFAAMRRAGYGRIVNTTSTAGLLGNFGQANYGSAKAGLYGLTRVLAVEGQSYGIKVNAIAPIASTAMAPMPPPMGDVFLAERVSPVVAYLVSEACELNGQVLSVAGGRVARFFLGLTPGWTSADLTAEDVGDNLAAIVAEDGYTVPGSAQDESQQLFADLLPPGSIPEPATLDESHLGRTFDVGRSTVDGGRARAYAAATNDDNPAYDGGVVPPLFAVVPTFSAILAAVAAVLPEPLLPRVVHGTHDIRWLRPLEPGTALDTISTAFGYQVHGGGTSFVVRMDSRDADGQPVLEQYGAFLIRGHAHDGDAGGAAPDHTFPESARGHHLGQWTVPVDEDQTFRYAEASGDESPIHLDADFARAVGLPGIIVHGLCTMAMCAQAVIRLAADGDPRRLGRLAVRFAGNVLPGSDVVTDLYAIDGSPGAYAFEAVSGESLVIKHGRAEIVEPR